MAINHRHNHRFKPFKLLLTKGNYKRGLLCCFSSFEQHICRWPVLSLVTQGTVFKLQHISYVWHLLGTHLKMFLIMCLIENKTFILWKRDFFCISKYLFIKIIPWTILGERRWFSMKTCFTSATRNLSIGLKWSVWFAVQS